MLAPAFVVSVAFAFVFRELVRANGEAVYRLTFSRMDLLALGALLALVRTGLLETVLCAPVLRYIGTISYTCYLVHDIALERVHMMDLPGAVTVALAFALTIGFATLSWYALEQPLGRLRGRVRVVPAC